MKAAILAALFAVLLLASSVNAQINSALTVATRLDYRTAEFSWAVAGDDPALVGYVVECGTKTGAYALNSQVLPIDAVSLLVSDVLRSNGTYYCVVAATDGKGVLSMSNEVAIAIKGRNLTLYQ